MTRMVRKQIYITKHQDETLKRLAAERGQTEAEVVRTCLDGLTSEEDEREGERRQAIDQLIASAREWAEQHMDAPPHPRDWTRDEIYEERLEKKSRAVHERRFGARPRRLQRADLSPRCE